MPTFDQPAKDFCDFFIIQRNSELHSSELPFESINESSWLPNYYRACKILAESTGRSLPELIGPSEGVTALTLVEALESAEQENVAARIREAKVNVAQLRAEERAERARHQELYKLLAGVWSDQSFAACPACGSMGRVSGSVVRESPPMLQDESLVVEEELLVDGFQCDVCLLRFHNVREVLHAGLEPHFKKIGNTDLHVFAKPEYPDEYNNM